MTEKVTTTRKFLVRKRRRRGRTERHLLRQSERRNQAHGRGREIAVATHNVRTMAVDGAHGVGQTLYVLSAYDRLGCDVISLQETRRSGHSAFNQAGYLVYCSRESGDENGGKKGQGGVGLAVRTFITRAARPSEFISDLLLKVTLELRGRAKVVTFFVAYAPTETQNARNKHAFWTTLDRAVEEVTRHEQLFVLMYVNARTGRREKGGVGSKDDKLPVDRRRLVTDPRLRQEVATAAGHLRANPPGDSSVDDVEAAFAAAIMRTAELVIPPQERRRSAQGWSGDAQTEAELQTATDAMHTAWQRLKTDTRDAQLLRAVRKACNWLKRVRSAGVRFFKRHVVELEK